MLVHKNMTWKCGNLLEIWDGVFQTLHIFLQIYWKCMVSFKLCTIYDKYFENIQQFAHFLINVYIENVQQLVQVHFPPGAAQIGFSCICPKSKLIRYSWKCSFRGERISQLWEYSVSIVGERPKILNKFHV